MNWGDLFAGGGGATTGAFSVPGVKVIWALNHNEAAIKTHQVNHPETIHYQSDIKIQDEHELAPVDGIWMSSECTNHSVAKGGKLLDLGSRSLPEELCRYAAHCKPSIIIVENVKEYLNWGPLDDKGRPIKKREGEYYWNWVKSLAKIGYTNHDYRLLNSADFGAHTSRVRYFGIFTKCGTSIAWPENTHSKQGDISTTKWKACRDKLDLFNFGESIFKKNLCENTLRRITAGLLKYGGYPFILKYNGNIEYNVTSVDEPIHTITGSNRHVVIQFLAKYYGSKGNVQSIEEPIHTITTKDRFAVITQFLTKHYNSSGNPESQLQHIDQPVGTITTNNKFGLVTQFISKSYNSNGKPELNNQSIEEPISTLTTCAKHALITASEYDICFRFITIQEAKELQGFPDDYILTGSKAEQLKQIGNSVVPLMSKVLIEANLVYKMRIAV